jgi:hypothetical protein
MNQNDLESQLLAQADDLSHQSASTNHASNPVDQDSSDNQHSELPQNLNSQHDTSTPVKRRRRKSDLSGVRDRMEELRLELQALQQKEKELLEKEERQHHDGLISLLKENELGFDHVSLDQWNDALPVLKDLFK